MEKKNKKTFYSKHFILNFKIKYNFSFFILIKKKNFFNSKNKTFIKKIFFFFLKKKNILKI
ncbi:MAG: hypothetical protein ACSHUF_00045 [Candidatus Nasuia deltocephalinicola]